MTQTGPAAQNDVLLPQGWSETNQASSLLFRLAGLELHLIPGSKFEAVADAVGTLRESTYRQQLSGSGSTRDLDGRDAAGVEIQLGAVGDPFMQDAVILGTGRSNLATFMRHSAGGL